MQLISHITKRLFLDRQAAFWLGARDPSRARVTSIIRETPDTKTFVLRPGTAWPGHRAGQHTAVEVEIDGARMRRCYSISSAPSDADVAITVKRAAQGQVSRWLHDHVREGDELRLGPPAGDFVLPEPAPARLLFISAGSGITPLMALLRDAAARGAIADLVFVHHARADVIFRGALEELAGRHRGLRLLLHVGSSERFDEARLAALVPDFAERETFLCGPPGFMARVDEQWQRAGAAPRLHRERFVPAPVAARASGDEVSLTLTRSGRTIDTPGTDTVLALLERAGERPAHGCRVGICKTCRCRKRSGTVENTLTGALSSEPDEDIQLCISIPRSDLELCL